MAAVIHLGYSKSIEIYNSNFTNNQGDKGTVLYISDHVKSIYLDNNIFAENYARIFAPIMYV